MFFVLGIRDVLVQNIPKNSVWAEVGVYRGDFSQKVLELTDPAEFYLIDNWRFDIEQHNPFSDGAENYGGFSGIIHWQHFGDDPNATQEQNFQYVKNRFAQNKNVTVIRSDSFEGIKNLKDGYFDVIYIDANHQYEYVLRDMTEARKKLKPGAIMIMNDFYEGPGGAEQNLGVIGAVNTFVKRHNFYYLAISHGAYADVALTDDPNSTFVREFLQNLKNSDLTLIGISDSIVPNIQYKSYRKLNGELRYVALL